MLTSQVYGHHDKMARTKTHRILQNTEYTKTQQTLRNNYFCLHIDGLFSLILVQKLKLILTKIKAESDTYKLSYLFLITLNKLVLTNTICY